MKEILLVILARKVFKGLITIFLLLLAFFCLFPDSQAFSLPASTKQPEVVDQAGSIAEIKTALEHLRKSVTEAIGEQRFTFKFQGMVLKKAEEFIGKIAERPEQSAPEADEKDIFMINREILKQILNANKKIISDIQENKLDRMKDPATFFRSPEWQEPQHLIALSSYWLGWNGYYGSLLFAENDAMRQTLLEEAIEGFSRSFLDSGEDAIIINSLFGRGLCYKQMKAYASALQDFKAVKETLNNNDPLYWQCGYEETLISYEMGNLAAALQNLEEMEKAWTGDKPSAKLKADLKTLKATVLVARLKKQEDRENKGGQSEEVLQRRLSELKELSKGDPGADAVFYHYVREQGGSLENRSYAELGPIGAMAIGDRLFEQNSYDKALPYYRALYADSPSVLNERMDGLCFRIAYIYCKKEAWKEAIPYLEKFTDRFPASPLMNQAVSLYYLAASNQYRENAKPEDYKTFIDALQVYLTKCTTCPGRSDAHFQLGKHYQKTDKMERALQEYSQVGKDSPDYGPAVYHVLKAQADQLESLRKSGQIKSKRATEIYRKGVRLIEKFQEAKLKTDESVNRDAIESAMIILQASFFLLGPDEDCKKSVKMLEGFESAYPGEKAFFIEALRLRMDGYLRLRMAKEAEKEVDRFIKASTISSEQYAGLLGLANRYDEEARLSQKKDASGTGTRQTTAALMIYKKLAVLAEKDPSRQQFRKLIQLRMAKIYLSQDKLRDAGELYQDILAKDPLSADAMYDLGLVYEKTGQWQEALRTWSKLSKGLRAGTKSWFEARYKTAYAFKKIGAKNKACALITMTMTLHPDLGSDILMKQYKDLRSEMCDGGR